jgi:hypothetical protein
MREVWTLRFLIGWAFDTFINLRYCIAEAVKSVGYVIDDALDAWGQEEDE